MNLLTPENTIFLLFCPIISLTIIFLTLNIAHLHRELIQMKIIFSYTLNTIKKMNPEFGTEPHIEEIINKLQK